MKELIRKIICEATDESAKFIKCRECKKKFTQTIHKGKKSFPICPHCGAHNTESKKQETNEGFKDFMRRNFPKYPYQHFQKSVDAYMDFMDFDIKKVKDGGREVIHFDLDGFNNPVIKVKTAFNKDGKEERKAYFEIDFIREFQKFIPQPGLQKCLEEWVRNRLSDNEITGWEIHTN